MEPPRLFFFVGDRLVDWFFIDGSSPIKLCHFIRGSPELYTWAGPASQAEVLDKGRHHSSAERIPLLSFRYKSAAFGEEEVEDRSQFGY